MNPHLPHTYIDFVFFTGTLVTRYCDVRIERDGEGIGARRFSVPAMGPASAGHYVGVYRVAETQLAFTDLPLNMTCLSETSALKQNSYLNWIPLNMTCLNETSALKQNSYLNYNQNSTDCLIIWRNYIRRSPRLVDNRAEMNPLLNFEA